MPRNFVANIFSPWILKANFAVHWVTLFWLFWNFGYFLQTQHENDSSAMLNSIHKTFRVVPKLLQYQRFSVRSVPKFEVPIFCLAKNFLWWHWVISFFLLSHIFTVFLFTLFTVFFRPFTFSSVITFLAFFFVGTTSSIIFYTYIWTSRCTLSVITRSMASSATRSFFAGFNCKYLNNDNCPDILILTIIINNQNVTTTNKWVFQSYSYCNLHKIISLIYKESYVENKSFQMKTILWYYIFFFVETMKVSTCIQDNRNPGILKMHWKFSMFFYMNLKRNYQNRAIYKKGKFIMYD